MAAIQRSPEIADSRPPGHVLVPAAAIGALSLLLSAGLGLLGMLDVINEGILLRLAVGGELPKQLPLWVVWLAAVFFSCGISFAVLEIPSAWRRVVVWISAVAVVVAWAPALALAAHAPEISAVLVATIWSGVCALVYAGRHRMPCEGGSEGKFQ